LEQNTLNLQIQPFDRSNQSELIDFKGKFRFVQAVDLNKFGKWSIQFYPDQESLEHLRELQAQGIKNVMKKDEDGYNIQISRPPSIEFTKGVQTPVSPPKVRDGEKKPIDGRTVGDGSSGAVTCELYTYKVPQSERRGKAIRFYGLTVTDLVPKAAPEVEPEAETAGWD
jgi:hypothetical protein